MNGTSGHELADPVQYLANDNPGTEITPGPYSRDASPSANFQQGVQPLDAMVNSMRQSEVASELGLGVAASEAPFSGQAGFALPQQDAAEQQSQLPRTKSRRADRENSTSEFEFDSSKLKKPKVSVS